MPEEKLGDEQAFPQDISLDGRHRAIHGMNKRFYVATHVLQGLLSQNRGDVIHEGNIFPWEYTVVIVKQALRITDEFLKQEQDGQGN